MEQAEVLATYQLLSDNGIEVWLDGGWGIDALIGEQTRPHSDLDVAIRQSDVVAMRQLLMERGYAEVQRAGALPWIFVLEAPGRGAIDVHVFDFDEHGTNIYGVAYPAESLTGRGFLGGKEVRCISAQWAVKFHSAYVPRAVDLHDLKLIHERLGVDVPDRYKA